jgi:subtilisin family serine protease
MSSHVDNPLQMNLRCSFSRRRARCLPLAALLFLCAPAPQAAPAATAPTAEQGLSPRLAELAKPSVRSAPAAEQAARLSLAPSGAGSLLRDGSRVLVDVRFERGAAAAVEELRAAGAEIVQASPAHQTVTVAARPADLPRIGALPRVGGVSELLTPIVRGADCGGAVRSEGDVQLHAGNARSSFGVDGSGVTVGILSDSFARNPFAATSAGADIASGDLPGPGSPCGSTTPIALLDDSDLQGDDEGRAMAQVVHDLAPGAAIDFATAFHGELAFAANIRALARAGAKVIVDDVAYPQEPFFQDGPLAVAIADVTAAGVSYFSAVGNDNLVDSEGRPIGSWEAPAFRDSGDCPKAVADLSAELRQLEEMEGTVPARGLEAEHCMDFDPAEPQADDTLGITVAPGATLRLDLQWAEPWNGVTTDLDAFLLDEAGDLMEDEGAVVASIEDNRDISQKPFEFLSWTNEGPEQEVRLAVNRFDGGASPRLKVALVQNGGGVSAIERPQPGGGDVIGPTVFGHAGAAAAIGVGAVRFNTILQPEAFSSRGPVRHYYGPVTGSAPPPALAAPELIGKPDLVASDGTVNTFFGPIVADVHRFFGTSAAAPHAAATAALMRQANPGAAPSLVREKLTATAKPVGSFGRDDVGAGLIDAYGAVEAIALPPVVRMTRAPAPLSRIRQPTIEFSANRPVSFSCEIDGGAPLPCASPFRVPVPLADGSHGIAVRGVDVARRAGDSGSVSFEIDTRAPRTRIAKHPRKLIRTHRRRAAARFRFRSDEAGVSFVCKVDRGLLRFCGNRLSRRFGPGKHIVLVRASDAAGNVDRTPAVFRFRVERRG